MIPRSRKVEDARARWLGYQDADHYLRRADDELTRKRRPDRWVWSHYRSVFMGQMPRAKR